MQWNHSVLPAIKRVSVKSRTLSTEVYSRDGGTCRCARNLQLEGRNSKRRRIAVLNSSRSLPVVPKNASQPCRASHSHAGPAIKESWLLLNNCFYWILRNEWTVLTFLREVIWIPNRISSKDWLMTQLVFQGQQNGSTCNMQLNSSLDSTSHQQPQTMLVKNETSNFLRTHVLKRGWSLLAWS